MLQPLCGYALEGVLDRDFLCGLLGLPLRHRVNAGRQQLAGLGVAFSRLRQRNIWIFAQGHELFLALKPIGPAPQLPAGRLDPEVESASIAHAVGFFRRLGPFDLRIGQSGHAIPPRQEKYTHFKNRIHPKVHPPKHGCTWMHLDAERRKA
jgi:hypothetical protein